MWLTFLNIDIFLHCVKQLSHLFSRIVNINVNLFCGGKLFFPHWRRWYKHLQICTSLGEVMSKYIFW